MSHCVVFKALDTTNSILFVSSHNRRNPSSTGEIFAVDVTTDTLVNMTAIFPPNFRPHGIAIVEGCSPHNDQLDDFDKIRVTRLFAISHVTMGEIFEKKTPSHTIEVFDFHINHSDSSVATLNHVETLSHGTLYSPNDLTTLSCVEFVVSNDLPRGGILDIVSGLLSKRRGATMVHYNWLMNVWNIVTQVQITNEVLPPSKAKYTRKNVESNVMPKSTVTTQASSQALASFGNGLILLPHKYSDSGALLEFPTHFLRSSSADYTLLQYDANHVNSRLKLSSVTEISLPISPDNIEPSPYHPMEVLVTCHPYLPYFLQHLLPLPSLLRPVSPSAVLRYNSLWRNSTLLYYDEGHEISASSVATISRALNNTYKLYTGQVFDSFILSCPLNN